MTEYAFLMTLLVGAFIGSYITIAVALYLKRNALRFMMQDLDAQWQKHVETAPEMKRIP